MILTVKHYVSDMDLAKAAQAVSEDKEKLTKKNIVSKLRELLFIHGEGNMDRDFMYDEECISKEEAEALVDKLFFLTAN